MENNRRLNVLLESFETLVQGNIENDLGDIVKIIGQISKYNIDIALELWRKLILKNKNLLFNECYAHFLTYDIINNFEKNISYAEIVNFIFKDAELSKLCFGDNVDADIMEMPINCLKQQMYEQAIKFYELIIESPRKYQRWIGSKKYIGELSKDEKIGYIFESGDTYGYFDNKSIEIMYSWIYDVQNEKIKASLNSIMISIEEAHDEEGA